jgi:hypothetical protein
MTERFSQKDLERAAKELTKADPETGKIACNICSKLYVHPATIVKHVIEEHLNDVMKKAEDIERAFEERWAKHQKESALKQGAEYFESLLYSIDSLKREVTRYKEGFEEARDGKRENSLSGMVKEIEWCIYHVTENFHSQCDKGVRAAIRIAKAFDLDA